jgi:hypothetical protein
MIKSDSKKLFVMDDLNCSINDFVSDLNNLKGMTDALTYCLE